MNHDPEQLRERLLDVERARQREHTLRRQSENLLQGLIPLGQAESVDDIFTTLTDLLRQHMSFEHALLITPDGDDTRRMIPIASTDERFADTRWISGGFFDRVRSQGPTSAFDIAPIDEWQDHPPPIYDLVQSALHIPLSDAMLICTDGGRGTFGPESIAFARRVAPLAAQGLQNIQKRQREIEFLRIEREHQRDFHRLIEHLPDAIWISQDQRVTYANKALVGLLDIDAPDALLGHPTTSIIHPNDADFFTTILDTLDDVGATSSLHEIRLATDAEPSPLLEVVALNLRFPDGFAQLCVGRDIRHRKEITTRLMQMDRMITAGTLAAGVGHEINNPLTYVISNIDYVRQYLEQFARSKTRPDPSQMTDLCDALKDAHDGGHQIADIVADLRLFSNSSEEAELEPIDIQSIVDSTRRMVKKTIQNKARYVEKIDIVPPVTATHSKLAQVLLNLLTNAAQAIPEGSVEDNLIEVRAYQQDDSVVLQVSDTGEGIDDDAQPQLFDLFFTTRSPDEGTGLGLPISHRNVTSFGGHIEFDSTPGEGTTFRVFLPIASNDTASSLSSDTTPDAPPQATIHLLVIDDEPTICTSLRRMLQDHATIECAYGAEEAFGLLDEHCFDAILCDVFMPGLSGLEFHRRLADQSPHLGERLAFMTGGIRSTATQQSLDALSNPLLQKPFSRQALVDTLNQLTAD